VPAEGFAFGNGTRLMRRLTSFHLIAAVVAFAGLFGGHARSAELEGALQYPPLSIGEDAQPPPPARMVPPLVSPRRIEIGGSGSSKLPDTERFFIRSPIRFDQSG
jgi:hypothetical protein